VVSKEEWTASVLESQSTINSAQVLLNLNWRLDTRRILHSSKAASATSAILSEQCVAVESVVLLTATAILVFFLNTQEPDDDFIQDWTGAATHKVHTWWLSVGTEPSGIAYTEHLIDGESEYRTENVVFVVSLHGINPWLTIDCSYITVWDQRVGNQGMSDWLLANNLFPAAPSATRTIAFTFELLDLFRTMNLHIAASHHGFLKAILCIYFFNFRQSTRSSARISGNIRSVSRVLYRISKDEVELRAPWRCRSCKSLYWMSGLPQGMHYLTISPAKRVRYI
jgi:hypothetical protein